MNTNEKAAAGAIRNGSESNNLITFGGNQKGFDVFNSSEKVEKSQCFNCNPPLTKPRSAMKLCADCEANTKQTAEVLFDNFRRHRKVIKLDCFCFACDTPKTSAMMHKIFPICRKCFDELRTKGATAQGNFLSRATNNFFKQLKGAITV